MAKKEHMGWNRWKLSGRRSGLHQGLLPAALSAVLLAGTLAGQPAYAAVKYFPGVTREMSSADYWLSADPAADVVLMDSAAIAAQNRRMVADPACCMYDLENMSAAAEPYVRMAEKAYREICDEYVNGKHFDRDGNVIDTAFAERVRDRILGADPASFRTIRYGIVVRRTDLRAWPTEEIVTDELGDIDFDYAQLSGAAVNAPFVIRGQTADGQWYYGCIDNYQGWVRAADVAVCRSKQEWLSFWKIPADRVLVVTESRFTLEHSNTAPEISGLELTMGTVLERADGAGRAASGGSSAAGSSGGPAGGGSGRIINRAAYQNYVVWIPVRDADGSCRRVKALISERHDVHEGYVPLTRRNILRTAMNALGDMYGWGGMLSAEDCSGFLHAVYACCGVNLPRDTSWQSAAPLFRHDLNYLPDREKAEVIGGLPAGTMLYFRGHAMLYLGERDGRQYVLSSVSSMMDPADPAGKARLRVRSVVINGLDIRRGNGNSWLRSLDTAVIPWLDPGAAGSGFRSFPDGIRFRRDNGSFAALNWQEVGGEWYFFDRDGRMAAERWIPARDEENTWYYVGPDGKMARDAVIDGYAVGDDGAWRGE